MPEPGDYIEARDVRRDAFIAGRVIEVNSINPEMVTVLTDAESVRSVPLWECEWRFVKA